MTVADMVAEQLALDLAEAEENVARYRILATASIKKIRELMLDNERVRRENHGLREQIRTLVGVEQEMERARCQEVLV